METDAVLSSVSSGVESGVPCLFQVYILCLQSLALFYAGVLLSPYSRHEWIETIYCNNNVLDSLDAVDME
jgi:hypothetical protein